MQVVNKAHEAVMAYYKAKKQERQKARKPRRRGGRFAGYNTYREYLKSDLWQDIRERVLDAADRTCQLCGSVATQVHHRHYGHRTLKGKTLAHLLAVCGGCHMLIEFDGETKRTARQAEAWLMDRLNTQPKEQS